MSTLQEESSCNMSTLQDESKRYYVKIGMGERLAYGFWGFGSDLVFQTITIYLTFFYTDIFGISPVQVTALFLAARVWDAINDPLMGAIVEKCHFKRGKYIPWFVGLCIPYGISTILVFTTPESISKVAYAWFTYILFGMLFTGIIIPVTSLSSSMTQDPIERAKLNSFRMFCSGIGGVVCAVMVPKLSELMGTSPQNGYQRAMIVLSAVMVISFLVAGKVCKERVPESAHDKEEPFHWRDIGSQFTTNKPLLILFVMYLAAYTYNILVSSVGTYFVTYNIGGTISMADWSLLQTLPSIIPMLFVPAIAKKVGKKMTVIYGCLISTIGMLLFFFMPDGAIVGFCMGKALGSFGYGITLAMIWSTLPDCVEYGEYVTGRRCGGLVFSLASFSIKISLTIAGILPTIVFSFVDYVPNGVQNAACLTAIKAMNSLIPAIVLIIGILVFSRYSLTEQKFESIVKELTKRRLGAQSSSV
ncbi:MFS transporter [Petroclostridium sp. X23]|uniref:MFS transporter n=1 Tax=Petroclostridium sp. X23 TaxID=3045146 RepID=UPI0024AE29DA|nr:MFS transporter [Petroclostridium sp. X23]WHH57171.1 MFS transporter [Petroclostridium sp. X23]